MDGRSRITRKNLRCSCSAKGIIQNHFGIAHHENSDITNNIYNGPDAYKDLQFLWFNKTWNGSALSLMLLNNVYLKYVYTKDQFVFDTHLQKFGAAADFAGDASSYLGTELDLSGKWIVNPVTAITLGYSTFFAGDSMEILKGGDSSIGQHWAYLMLSVTPSFIK